MDKTTYNRSGMHLFSRMEQSVEGLFQHQITHNTVLNCTEVFALLQGLKLFLHETQISLRDTLCSVGFCLLVHKFILSRKAICHLSSPTWWMMASAAPLAVILCSWFLKREFFT